MNIRLFLGLLLLSALPISPSLAGASKVAGAPSAEANALVGEPSAKGAVEDFGNEKAWSRKRLPLVGENVLVRCSARLSKDRPPEFTREIGSLAIEHAAALQVASDLVVRRNLQVAGSLELIDANLMNGGTLSVGGKDQAGSLTILLTDYRPFPIIRCADLELDGTSTLSMRWWYREPVGMPDNERPIVEIRNQLKVQPGARLVIALEGFAEGYYLPAGDYLLLKAQRIIGDPPKLEVSGGKDQARPVLTLVVKDDRSGLVLRIRPSKH